MAKRNSGGVDLFCSSQLLKIIIKAHPPAPSANLHFPEAKFV